MKDMTYSEAIREGLAEEMERDERVFVLGEDVVVGFVFGVTKGLAERFGPRRVLDTPISEPVIAGAALGAALAGERPVAELEIGDFITLAMDQLVNQAAKIRYMTGGQAKVPMVVRAPMGVAVGFAAQHSQSLHAWLVHTPGLKVVAPSTPADAKGLIKSAIRDDNPVVFVEHKRLYPTRGPVPEGEHLAPLGKADVKRTGRDVTIVATAYMVQRCLAAAEKLAAEGIDVSVIDPRTLSPLDLDPILADVKRTSRLVVVDEGAERCGFGSHIAAEVAEHAIDYLDAPILRVGLRDTPIPFQPDLEEAVIPNEGRILAAVRKVVGK